MFLRLLLPALFHSYVPIAPIHADLGRVELSIESAFKLRVAVTIEAKNGQIIRITVTRILINVVDLNRLPSIPTHAARPM
jgi:hypothetical protein